MHGSTSFGDWVRQRRKALGFSQADLAARATCGFETIRKIEAGQRRPSEELARALGQALQIASDEVDRFIEFARHGGQVPPRAGAEGLGAVLSPPERRTSPSNLLPPRTSFVGRRQEVAQIQALLTRPDVRLVTLLGPPGIGKTRLSQQVAAELRDQFADGVFFVALAALNDPAQVAPAIARAVDLKEVASHPLTTLLQEYLQDKRLLLLLDNFEQLTPARTLVGALIEGCPEVKVLVTSRAVLGVYGEQQFPVPPLALPEPTIPAVPDTLGQYEAVDLFTQRARAIKPFFTLTPETAPVVAEICRHLEGLPLAIELAAGRSKLFSPREILQRLTNRLGLLTAGSADLPRRQRTMRDAISWSYDLLDQAEQRLFRRMAVFVRGGTLEAVAAVCRLPGEPEEDSTPLVDALLDQTLLFSVISPETETRYSMLWVMREYGQERLAEQGEADALGEQHAAYYLKLAEEADPHLRGAGRDPWLRRLEEELHNLRAALTWCLATPARAEWGLRLAGALHWFWYFRGYLTEGRLWLEKVLAAPTAPTVARAKALAAAGRLAFLQEDYAVMRARLEESVAIGRNTGDPHNLAYALTTLGFALVYRGTDAGDTGLALIEEGIQLFHTVDDRWGLAYALDAMGDTVGLLDYPQQEIIRYKEASLKLYQELGDPWGTALELSELGHLALLRGDYEVARTKLEDALPMERALGERWQTAVTLRGLGDVAWLTGDGEQAILLYQESLTLYRELGDQLRTASCLRILGHIAHHRGDDAEAIALYRQSLTLSHKLGNVRVVALGLAALAEVALARGRLERATRLFAATHNLRATSHGPLPAPDLAAYERTQAAVHNLLGEPIYAAAWEHGQALTMAQAVAYANSDDPDLGLEPQPTQWGHQPG